MVVGTVVGLCSGCSSLNNTRLTQEDYQAIATSIVEKLQTSDLLSKRGSDSPALILTISKVVNWTTDQMSDEAKWLLLEKVKNALPSDLLTAKNVAFTIPADQLAAAQRCIRVEGFARGRAPTHVLSATLRSVTRRNISQRTDLYYCEYSITDLADGEIIWTGRYEFTRTSGGKTID